MSKLCWLHIGAGAFHRSHQAWYFNQLIKLEDAKWEFSLGNIRSDADQTLNALMLQKGEYVLDTVTPEGIHNFEKIASITKIITRENKNAALINQGALSYTRVISFAVTVGGYYLKNDFRLDQSHPDIANDLKYGNEPCTIYGVLRGILAERKEKGNNKVTLLCCDNLRHNGSRFYQGLLEFITLTGDNALLNWVKEHTSAPNCMVDRITPKSDVELTKRVKNSLGFNDDCPVMSESFIQWIIEDNFAADRPALERVGVMFVKNVEPYEEAKVRILNATHAFCAWAGTLIGKTYIHEDIATHVIKKWHGITLLTT
nr:mannitol dehydrogenase family protein [Raoultella sp. BIGb0399]